MTTVRNLKQKLLDNLKTQDLCLYLKTITKKLTKN